MGGSPQFLRVQEGSAAIPEEALAFSLVSFFTSPFLRHPRPNHHKHSTGSSYKISPESNSHQGASRPPTRSRMLATLLVKCKSSYTPLKPLKSLFFHSEKAKILQKGLQGPHPQHPQPDLISHHALQASLTFCFSNKQRCPPASWPWHRHSLFPCTLKGLYSFPYSLITVSPLRMNLQDANFQRCEHASGSRRNWNPCHQHQAWHCSLPSVSRCWRPFRSTISRLQ